MDQLLERLEQIGSCKDMLRQACKRNGLNTSLGGELTVPKLKLLNQKFKKASLLSKCKIESNWMENELKTFNWILIAISALENALIADFDQKHWILLQNIFQFKTRNFLKFEARRFMEEKKAKNKNWDDEENELLLKIVNEMQKNDQVKIEKEEASESEKMKEEESMVGQKLQTNSKVNSLKEKIPWNQAARRLFQCSNEKYFRSAKHCRERWYNYIDPSKERGKWTAEENETLLAFVNSNGNKWAEIAGILHRTEHNVKNRYHSLQIKGKKQPKRKVSDNLKAKTPSIEDPKLQIFSIKEQNEKEPMITITEFPERVQKGKESIKVAQEIDCLEQIEDLQPILRTDDPCRGAKNEFYLYSPFPPYSPKNITPFMSSPSPLTFSLYNIHSFVTDHQKFIDVLSSNRDNIFPNDKQ